MKPYWPRTRQLLPVHLQASDAYAEGLLDLRIERLSPHAMGVVEMRTDEASWQRGLLAFKSLSAVMPSGLLFSSPEPLTRDGLTLPVGTTSIFLALAKTALRGPNVLLSDSPREPGDRLRYLVQGEPSQPWLLPDARLITRAEVSDDMEVVRLGRVERSGSRLQWQSGSIPTASRVRASVTLKAGLDRLVSALSERKLDLLRFRTDHPFRVTAVPPGELPGLHLLAVVQRYLPVLSDEARQPNLTPRELYATLVELYGALSTFGATDALVPPYVHDRQSDSLPWLFREIAKLVDEAARDRTTALPFTREGPATFRLTFEREALVGKRPFLVGSGADEAFLRDRVPSLLKMASPSAMPPLLQSALRGVAVAVEFEPASSIPRRRDVVTYRIDIRDPLWLDIEDRRSVVLYVPNAPPTLAFVLYGVERTV